MYGVAQYYKFYAFIYPLENIPLTVKGFVSLTGRCDNIGRNLVVASFRNVSRIFRGRPSRIFQGRPRPFSSAGIELEVGVFVVTAGLVPLLDCHGEAVIIRHWHIYLLF
jgi:hypothetical protein